MKKYLVEFLGTFFLVLTINLVVLQNVSLAAFAIAGTLMFVIYAGGYISGANYNPGVSTGLYFLGKLDLKDYISYVVCQVAGAVVATFIASQLVVGSLSAVTSTGSQIFLAEFLYSFALVFTVIHTAVLNENKSNSFYGFAIGLVVLAGALSVGSISGGAFNSAVAVSLSIIGVASMKQLWIYVVANLLAGFIAAKISKCNKCN